MKSVALCLFVLASCIGLPRAALAADAGAPGKDATLPLNAKSMPEIWEWCDGKEPEVFKDVEVLFQNYPLVPGEDVTIIFRGEALEQLDNVVVKSSVTLNKLLNFTDVRNLCLGPSNRCPLVKGYQEQTFTYPVIPTLFGSLSTKSVIYASGKPVACMKIGPLAVQRPQPPRFGERRS